MLGRSLMVAAVALGTMGEANAAEAVPANAVKEAIFVRLVAKPGQEEAVAKFLEGALPLVNAEPGTALWFAVRFDARTFAIFDAFADDAGRQAHLAGKVAEALMANADALLAEAPVIETPRIMAKKIVQ